MAGHSAQGVVRVSRKPKTASETEIVRLITATNESTPIGNFSQLVKDLAAAGIVIGTNEVVIKGDKVKVLNGNDEVAMFEGGKLSANLINAKQIVADGLKANTFDAGNATINNLIVTNAQVTGKITATSGKIGYFNINANGTITYGEESNGKRDFGLTNNCIYFTHKKDGENSNDSIMWLGRTIQGLSPQVTANLWIDEEESSPTHSKACLYLTAKGYTGSESNYANELCGNFAIYAVEGMYAGFRPAIRTISSNMTLTQMDCVLLCTNSQQITLTLPTTPQKGQMYYIFQYGKNIIVKSPNSNYKILGLTAENVTQFSSNQHLQGSIFIFSGEKWIVNYMNG